MKKLLKVYALFSLFLCHSVSANSTEWIELLTDIEPEKNTISGQWNMTENGLAVEAEANARLQLPNSTGDYDVRMTFTRRTGVHSITFIFTVNGKQAGFELDAWGQHLAGIQMIDNLSIKDNLTRVNNIQLENNRVYTFDLQVRGNIVTGMLDGEVITELDTSEHQLSVLNLWQLPDKNALGIGAYDSQTVFHSIKLRKVNANKKEKVEKVVPVDVDDSRSIKMPEVDNDLLSLSDEFNEDGSLKYWQRIYNDEGSQADQLESIEIDEKQGKLVLFPYTSSWYQDYRGVLVYKSITGDFIATTHVQATGRNGKAPPNKQYSLAGIMVRTPRKVSPETWRPGNENYIFLSLGSANKPGTSQFEVKTTINSDSKLEISSAESTEAEIRVIRIGTSFILMKRESGGDWNIHRRYHRTDMPETLQVGMTVYTDWQNVERVPVREHNQRVIKNGAPDLKAQFDYFRFKRPANPEKMKATNLSDPSVVSDSELLKLFSD